MKGPGFQWYVAWRYLMARPRRLSGSIVGFAVVVLWVLLGVGAALWWLPLLDEILTAKEVVPLWLAAASGLGVALWPVALVGMIVQMVLFSRGWRLSGLLIWTGLWGALVALAILGVAGWVHESGAALPASAPLYALSLLQMPIAVRWLAGRRRDWQSLLVVGVEIFLTGCLIFFAGHALIDVLPAAWPPPTSPPPLWLAFPAALAIILLPFAVNRVSRRQAALRVGALLCSAVLGTLAIYIFWALGGIGWIDASMIGPGPIQPPMALLIPIGIAGALIPLSLILLAVRYLFTFFTTVSIGGVAIGSMALVIVLSVMNGFESDLRTKILGSNAHIQVTKADENAQFTEYRDVAKEIADTPGVVAETPYLLSEVVVTANNNYGNVIIKGIDPHTIGDVTDLAKDIEQEGALERLWPLAEDGSTLGPPKPGEEPGEGGAAEPGGDAGPVVDPAPDDFGVPEGGEPIDLTGPAPSDRDASPGRVSDAGVGAAPVDPAPDDFAVPDGEEPIDLSGNGPFDDDEELEPLPTPDEFLFGDQPAGEGNPADYQSRAVDVDEDFDAAAELERRIPPRIAVLPGVLVGRELVKQINLYAGQEVKIISPLGQNTPAGPVPRTKPLRVAGTFFTGMYEYDLKYIYVELGTLQDFLDVGDEVKGIEVRVEDPSNTGPVKEALRRRLGDDFKVQDWTELNRSLFSALKLEKIAMFLVLAIIILVASFSIVGNLIMVVVEKVKEISIIKTLGAPDGAVMRIFIAQGFFIGLVGTFIGVILGLTACWLGIVFGLPLDPDVYYIDRLPIHVEPVAVLAVAAAGILISVVATLYPAYLAARTEVVQGLRYE